MFLTIFENYREKKLNSTKLGFDIVCVYVCMCVVLTRSYSAQFEVLTNPMMVLHTILCICDCQSNQHDLGNCVLGLYSHRENTSVRQKKKNYKNVFFLENDQKFFIIIISDFEK